MFINNYIRKTSLLVFTVALPLIQMGCSNKSGSDQSRDAGNNSKINLSNVNRSDAVDLTAPKIQVARLDSADLSRGNSREFLIDIVGIGRGQVLLSGVRILNGDCPGNLVAVTTQLLKYNKSSQVEKVFDLNTMEPLGVEIDGRYSIYAKVESLSECTGVMIELSLIGFHQLSSASGDNDSSATAPVQSGVTDPLPSPRPSQTPSPLPTVTATPDPTPIVNAPLLGAELMAFGSLSPEEGCRLLWRKKISDIIYNSNNLNAPTELIVGLSDNGLLKISQKLNGTILNLVWIHGLDTADAQDAMSVLSKGEKLGFGPADDDCTAVLKSMTTAHAEPSKFLSFESPESLLMFSGHPINECLATPANQAAVLGRGDWVASGAKKFAVRHKFQGANKAFEAAFTLEDKIQDKNLREALSAMMWRLSPAPSLIKMACCQL